MDRLIATTDKRSFQRRSLPGRPSSSCESSSCRASHEICKACMFRTRLNDDFESLRATLLDEFQKMKIEIVETIHEAFSRFPPRELERFKPERRLRLHFISNPKVTTFTEDELKTECGDNIQVALFNANNEPVTEDLFSNCQLEVVLLKGDFDASDEGSWTAEEFENHIEKGRNGKGQLLAGQLKFSLRGGVGTLGSIKVMDNSSWTRSRTFRLGLRVSRENIFCAKEIREGKSQAFNVKEKRGKGQKKHDKPALVDEVWRLEKISRSGRYHMKLNAFGIHKVKDFLIYNYIKPQVLKEVMLHKYYQAAVEHAQSCELGTLFLYKKDELFLVLNNHHELLGIFSGDQYTSVEQLGNSAKIQQYQSLVKSASCVKTCVEPLCSHQNLAYTKGLDEYSDWNSAYIEVVDECSQQNLAYTTLVGGFSHRNGADFKLSPNPVQHYVVAEPYVGETSVVDECDVFSQNECDVSSHPLLSASQCTIEQENNFVQHDMVPPQLLEDMSILNDIIMESSTQYSNGFSDMKLDVDDVFCDSSSILEAEDVGMDWFVGDPFSVRTSRVWLRIWTFMRCAFLIRGAGRSSIQSFKYQGNFHQDVAS